PRPSPLCPYTTLFRSVRHALDQKHVSLRVPRAQGTDRPVRLRLVPASGQLHGGKLDDDQIARPRALEWLIGTSMNTVPAGERSQRVVDALQVRLDLVTEPGLPYHGNSIGSHRSLHGTRNIRGALHLPGTLPRRSAQFCSASASRQSKATAPDRPRVAHGPRFAPPPSPSSEAGRDSPRSRSIAGARPAPTHAPSRRDRGA